MLPWVPYIVDSTGICVEGFSSSVPSNIVFLERGLFSLSHTSEGDFQRELFSQCYKFFDALKKILFFPLHLIFRVVSL